MMIQATVAVLDMTPAAATISYGSASWTNEL